jgi:hypothetical protein
MGFWVWVGLVGGKEMDRGGFAFPDGGMAKTRFFLLFIALASMCSLVYVASDGKKDLIFPAAVADMWAAGRRFCSYRVGPT